MKTEVSFSILRIEDEKIIKKIIWSLVKIHEASFKGFFLSFLGPQFLFRLYLSIADDPNGIIIRATFKGEIVAFVAGVMDQEKFYRRLIKDHKWKFAMASIPAIVRRPGIIKRIFRALNKPREAEEYSSKACLMSIGVDPNYQGKGIGEGLVNEFCEELKKRGCRSFCLTTDRDNNEKANNFYKKLGFILIRTFITPEGRTMNEYLKILNGEI